MKKNFDQAMKWLLKHEGGFTADKHDRGNSGDGYGNQGSTNLGVTARVWADWTGQPAPIEVMKKLKASDVGEMYRARYWNRVKADDLDHGVDVFTFDWCVNAGPKRPSQALQRIIGATPDGAIGPKTLQAAANFDAAEVCEKMHTSRQKFYESLTQFERYGRGWTRRNDEMLEQALSLLD